MSQLFAIFHLLPTFELISLNILQAEAILLESAR